MIDELKPCPFCGGEKMMAFSPNCAKDGPYNPGDNAQPIVRCMTCFAEAMGTAWDLTKESAVTAWNRRAAKAQAAPVRAVVKPLEWVPTRAIRKHLVEGETVIEMTAKGNFLYTLVQNYQIGMSWSAYRGRNSPISNGTCVSLNAAKSAAQADYERRILSSLAGQS